MQHDTMPSSSRIPQHFINEVREAVAGPAPNGGKMLCRVIKPDRESHLALSIIAYSNQGQLCLRYDQYYLHPLENVRFDPKIADEALRRALAFQVKAEALLADAVPPNDPKEDITREDQRKWARLQPYEVLLTMRVADDGRAHFALEGLATFPRWAMRCALGEAGDCLGMYAQALDARTSRRSAGKATLRTLTGYVAEFMLLGYATTDLDAYEEVSDVAEGEAWAEEMVEGREELLTAEEDEEELEEEGVLASMGNLMRLSAPEVPAAREEPMVSLATLPYDLLWEIGAYYMPEDRTRVPVGSALQTIRALSGACKRFRVVYQPVLFRSCYITHQGHVERLFRALNGNDSTWYKPCPTDADALTRKLFANQHLMPIADIVPAVYDKAFLRNAVVRVDVRHMRRQQRDSWYGTSSEDNHKDEGSGIMDLRFLLQMMPNLRYFSLADQNQMHMNRLLDKTARVLHKFTDLEHFAYSHGKDLCEIRPRLAFGRVVGDMKRLTSLRLAYLEVGPCPWVMPAELGLGADPRDGDYELLGADLWLCVWFRPQLLMRETPSASWLPTGLTKLELTDVVFRAPEEGAKEPSEPVMERLRKHCALAGANMEKQSGLKGIWKSKEKTKEDDEGPKVTWTTWPPDFHPFARLVLTPQNTLRELYLDRIRGVPSAVYLHVLKAVGPRLDRLTLARHRGDTPALVRCCPKLTYVSLDAYVLAESTARHMLDGALPRTLAYLSVRQPWPAEVLHAWAKCGCADLPVLKHISLSSWGDWVSSEAQYALLRALKDECAARSGKVGVYMPASYYDWEQEKAARAAREARQQAQDDDEEQEEQEENVEEEETVGEDDEEEEEDDEEEEEDDEEEEEDDEEEEEEEVDAEEEEHEEEAERSEQDENEIAEGGTEAAAMEIDQQDEQPDVQQPDDDNDDDLYAEADPSTGHFAAHPLD